MSGLKTLFTIRAVLAVAASFASTTAKDDSSWINSGILAAIKSGQNSYTVPAGTYYLQHAITIPPGTHNFTLKGAGSSQTILTAPAASIPEMIVIGPTVSGYWPFTQAEVALTENVTTGQTTLYTKPGTNIVAGHYIDLFDLYVQHPNTDPNVSASTHSELVKVTAYNKATGAITIDTGACREYTNPYIADVNGIACANIAVQGFGFNGAVTNSTSASGIFVYDQLTDNFYATNIVGSTYSVAVVEAYNSRNVLISNCVGNSTTTSDGGYAFFLEDTHHATVQYCSAQTAQHGFEIHGGSTDVLLNNDTETSAPFDMHGMDERRVTIENCTGDFSCGNAAWANGDSEITLTNDTFNTTVFGAYVNTVNATSCNFTDDVWLDSYLHNQTTPTQAQAPTNLNFTSCVLSAPAYDVPNDPVGGKMTFTKCTLNSNMTTWGFCLNWSQMSGASIDLESCTLNMGPNNYPAVVLTGQNISFKMNNCAVRSNGAPTNGVQVGKAFQGSLYFNNNTFKTTNAKPVFISNASPVKIQS